MNSNLSYYLIVDRPYEGTQIVACSTLKELDYEIVLAKELYGNESTLSVIEGQLSKLSLRKYDVDNSIRFPKQEKGSHER